MRPLARHLGAWPRAAMLACCLFGFAHRADAQATVTDQRVWFTLVFQERADAPGHWRWTIESFARSRDGVSTLDNAAFRPSISYVFNKHSTIGGGWAYVENWPDGKPEYWEQRVFEQYVFSGTIPTGSISVRERMEQRFIENNDATAWRLRQQVRYSHPLKAKSPIALLTYDEFFLHLNTTKLTRQGIDQNRYFAGISDTINKAWKFELGYLNQYTPSHGGIAAPKMNHVLSGNLTISF